MVPRALQPGLFRLPSPLRWTSHETILLPSSHLWNRESSKPPYNHGNPPQCLQCPHLSTLLARSLVPTGRPFLQLVPVLSHLRFPLLPLATTYMGFHQLVLVPADLLRRRIDWRLFHRRRLLRNHDQRVVEELKRVRRGAARMRAEVVRRKPELRTSTALLPEVVRLARRP